MVDVEGVHTRDELRAALKELKSCRHLSLDEIVKRSGVPKTTVSEFLSGKTSLLYWSTLAPVLAALGVTDADKDSWERAYGRAKAENIGEPLGTVVDPFELDVHRPISVGAAGELAALPVYVARDHDATLAQVVAGVRGGSSAMVMLVAGPSAGKTRALWEALEPLREAGGWRLWRPEAPTRREAIAQLDRVRPRTVVWLNDSWEYLRGELGGGDERAALMLRSLLTDTSRAPVLVVGTLWFEHHRALCQDPPSQTAKLLDDAVVIEVPERFVGRDLKTLRQVAVADPRLAAALRDAEDSRITQYLAGAPELVKRYRFSFSPTARAIIDVAADALRMGHRNCLPYSLLRDAAPCYLFGSDRDQLSSDLIEQALAETGEPVKGARGAVTHVHPQPRRGSGPPWIRAAAQHGDPAERDGQLFQLNPILHQYCLEHRADVIPPIGFWEAIVTHGSANDRSALGDSAWNRGLYRDAAQLWKGNAEHGDTYSAARLVRALHQVKSADDEAITWITDHASADGVDQLIDALGTIGAGDQAIALIRRTASEIEISDADIFIDAAHRMGGTDENVAFLAHRLAAGIALDDAIRVAVSIGALWEAGFTDDAFALAHRAAPDVCLTDPSGVVELMDTLTFINASGEATIVARRAATEIRLVDVGWTTAAVLRLWEAGATDEAVALARRAATDCAVDNPAEVATLIRGLQEIGATDAATMLVERAASAETLADARGDWWVPTAADSDSGTRQGATITVPRGLILALELRRALEGAETADIIALVDDTIRSGSPVDSAAAAVMARQLRGRGATEEAMALLRCASASGAVNDASATAMLIDELHAAEATREIAELAQRVADGTPAAAYGVAGLVIALWDAGATDEATALAHRFAVEGNLNDARDTAAVIQKLRTADASDYADILAQRLPAAGLFGLYITISDHHERFQFGREPDGSPATAWGWAELG